MLEVNSSSASMEATTQQPLQQLAQQLQIPLRRFPHGSLIQVQCVVRAGNLMVLGQHPLEAQPNPQAVFGALEQALPNLLAEFAEGLALGAETAQAKLYLRAFGQQQPYAAHTFLLPPSFEAPSVAETFEPFTEPFTRATDAEWVQDRGEPIANEADLGDADLSDGDASRDATWLEAEASDLVPHNSVVSPIAPTSSRFERSSLLPWLIAGVGVSIVGFTGGLWFMSRPCMAGVCEPLQAAQTLNQQSLQTQQTAKTQQDLQQAQQQLTEAKQRLQSIPTWSRHYNEAQALQQTTQAQAQLLDRVLEADTKANAATQKSQALPLATADLQATQTLWREAIAQLQTIPAANPLYAYAQQRLTASRADVAAIGKLTIAEQQAQQKLATAKATAKIAEARQGIAQTPESWQLAQITWQVVINTLREIATSSTSYAEAQRLLSDYQPKLTAARDRATQEQIAQKAFNQAIALAKKAEAAQSKNQWSQAVVNWQDALTNIKQVPTNTAYAEPAQPLVASYGTALKQAQAQLQVATALQRTRDDLNRICAGSPRLCTYAITNDLIRVQFTPAYERKLRTAFIIGQAGDRSTLGGAVNHIETLQTALQTISDNAGLPLEVYNADGSDLVGSFNPKG